MASAIRYRIATLLVMALLGAVPVLAVDTLPVAASLVASLGGRWTGTLSYRDYGRNAQVQLPMVSEIVELADGATVIGINRFADRPKVGVVTATDVSLFDSAANRVTSAAFRRGKAVTSQTSKVQVARYSDRLHWTIIYTLNGSDNGQPALIRLTQTRDANALTARNEVQHGTTPGVRALRSGSDLTRDADAMLPSKK